MSTPQALIITVLILFAFGIFPLLALLWRAHDANKQAATDHANQVNHLTGQFAHTVNLLLQERDALIQQRNELQKSQDRLKSDLAAAEATIDKKRRHAWLDDVKKLSSRDEYEISVRIAYQLLRMTGYQDSNILLRHPLTFPVGPSPVTVFVDFLAYLTPARTTPFLLLHVASPSEPVDNVLIGRVRSYAYGANCA
jgi:hypothetical protein